MLASLGTAVIVMGACSACAAQNLVNNPGFEVPVLGGAWEGRVPGTVFGGWTVDNVGNGVAQVGSFGHPAAIEGFQFVELNLWASGGISQTFTTQAGSSYVLSFLMAGQTNAGPDTKVIQVEFDGSVVDSPSWSVSGTGGEWVRHTYTVTSSGESSTLRFLGAVPSNDDGGPYVDDVRVVWCLELLGQPSARRACVRDEASFAVDAAGVPSGGEVRFQWQYHAAGQEAWSDLEDGVLDGSLAVVSGSRTAVLRMQQLEAKAAGEVRCVVANGCLSLTSAAAGLAISSADFNNDGDVGTDEDIGAFFACIAGNCCGSCGSADFDADGDIGTDADIESFFRVLAGGPC